MSTDPDIKARRKALGWDRAELAKRAALDKHVVQLIEMGQWSEEDALGRVQYVLGSAESGDLDVQLEPVKEGGDGTVLGR
jgi:ribosome-binding protein aMBF1 (putative translation factor)